MSLILDALKKSEAERRLGQAPGLLSPAAPVRRRHGLWPLLLVLVLAVVLSTGITWWLLRPAPSTIASEDPAPAPTQRAPSADEPAAAAAPPATAVVPAPQPAAAPVQPSTPSPEPATPRPAVERESAPMAADATLLEPPPRAAPPARQDTTPVRAAPAPAEARPTLTASPATPAAEQAQPQPSQVAEPTGPAEPPVPPLRTLPGEVQAALPPLKLSMHVFNEDPAQRFVLIDGRRYGEGMAVADGLVLEAIRRDGVVLVFRGHRFHLPRPG